MSFLLENKEIFIIGLILLVIIVLIIVLSTKKNTKEEYIVDNEYIISILAALGSRDNIESMSIDDRRLAFKLFNINEAKFDDLKKLSNTGAFIVGNTVKVLFKYDSQKIKREIEKRGK